LYYACFYAVLALFTKHNIESHTHSGAKTQLSLHFVKTGKLEKDDGMLYGDLFDLRQKGDYGDFFDFEEQHINTYIPKVEGFLKKIESLTRE
jgi:uncharacterized protein (UPF0332 family)